MWSENVLKLLFVVCYQYVHWLFVSFVIAVGITLGLFLINIFFLKIKKIPIRGEDELTILLIEFGLCL